MENNKNNKNITIITQEFYGNRTMTEVKSENIDNFILGYLNEKYDAKFFNEKIDRTIINIPNTNLAIIYNKYQEDFMAMLKAKICAETGYEAKPTAIIPEKNLKLYSRCIACRINENGNLNSIKDSDYSIITKYFTA